MFQSFRVRNFRCFSDLQVENLARVNLIAGKNNVGKTSFLEALFLHLGPDNPELSLQLNALRGIPWFGAIPEETWGWLFFGKNTDTAIHSSSVGADGERRDLLIRLEESDLAAIPPAPNGKANGGNHVVSATTARGARELVLEYREGSREPVVSRASLVVQDQGLKVRFKRGAVAGLPLGIYLTSAVHYAQENAQRFSKMQEVGREQEVLEPLKLLEPRLRGLVVSAMGPGIPVMQGEVGIGRLVPLPLMGDGLARLLSYLLAIADAAGGTVLIDEFENGLHHSVLDRVWEAIAEFAERNLTQVFATTHSWDCVGAAHKAFSGRLHYDFRMHRLDRKQDESRAVTYDKEALSGALDAELEVR